MPRDCTNMSNTNMKNVLGIKCAVAWSDNIFEKQSTGMNRKVKQVKELKVYHFDLYKEQIFMIQ